MIFFLDSSALVKRYIAEAGSDMVSSLFAGKQMLAVSWLALPETLAAITRRAKGSAMSAEDLLRVKTQLALDWQRFLVVYVAGEPVSRVEALIARHGLRGADSIHLSTALWLGQTTNTPINFVAADSELIAAADAERLQTINPQVHPDAFTV
ncbi:MAG: PIN domain-containing protein [Gaiellales bacterium]|nr:MAG: PIN domain-containing protein [Gaiellales bacterium]